MSRAFYGGAWHGPAVLEILDGVTAGLAAARPITGAHSIWEITLHLTGTQGLLLRRLRGDASDLTPDEDWPPVPEPSEAAWRSTVERLKGREQELHAAVASFPDERLDEPLVPGGSSAYNNFHGHVQHNLYHAAQIGLLKRAAA